MYLCLGEVVAGVVMDVGCDGCVVMCVECVGALVIDVVMESG